MGSQESESFTKKNASAASDPEPTNQVSHHMEDSSYGWPVSPLPVSCPVSFRGVFFTSASGTMELVKVGSRVSVWLRGAFHAGTVMCIIPINFHCIVKYDDGGTWAMDFSKASFHVLHSSMKRSIMSAEHHPNYRVAPSIESPYWSFQTPHGTNTDPTYYGPAISHPRSGALHGKSATDSVYPSNGLVEVTDSFMPPPVDSPCTQKGSKAAINDASAEVDCLDPKPLQVSPKRPMVDTVVKLVVGGDEFQLLEDKGDSIVPKTLVATTTTPKVITVERPKKKLPVAIGVTKVNVGSRISVFLKSDAKEGRKGSFHDGTVTKIDPENHMRCRVAFDDDKTMRMDLSKVSYLVLEGSVSV